LAIKRAAHDLTTNTARKKLVIAVVRAEIA